MNRHALELLHKIAPDKLKEDETRLLALIHRRPCPISRFSFGLLWLDVKTEPEELRHIHEQQKFTFYFECADDITESIRIPFVYMNNGRQCFRDVIGFANGNEFTMRIGEIVSATREWQTAVKCLTGIHRVPSNGSLGVMAQTDKARPTPAATIAKIAIE